MGAMEWQREQGLSYPEANAAGVSSMSKASQSLGPPVPTVVTGQRARVLSFVERTVDVDERVPVFPGSASMSSPLAARRSS